MTAAYGREFSLIFSQQWDLWSRMLWPVIMQKISVTSARERDWLDLCCGAGSLLRLAQKQGFRTVGVDLSPHQLRHARRKSPASRLVLADVRHLHLRLRFDVISCMFDSLNYLTSLPDLFSAMRTAGRLLKQGGRFFFDIKTAQGFRRERERVFRTAEHVTAFTSSFDEASRVHTFRVTGFLRAGELYRRFDEEHVQRAYELEEIEELAADLGMRCEALDCDTLEPPGAKARRLLCICSHAGAA